MTLVHLVYMNFKTNIDSQYGISLKVHLEKYGRSVPQCGKELVPMPNGKSLSIQNSHGRKREPTCTSCPLTSAYSPWQVPLL